MGHMTSASGGGTTTAIEDDSGTPALASGITEAEMRALLNLEASDIISTIEGEATLNLAGDVTMTTGKTLLVPNLVQAKNMQLGYGTGPAKLQVYNSGDSLELYSAGDSGGNVKILDLDAGTDGAEANRIAAVSGHLHVSQNVGIGTTAPSEMLHLSDSDASEPTLLLENTGTSTSEPNLMFRRSGSHPSDPTVDIGRIAFEGDNTNNENILYAAITGDAHVATDGDERGRMRFHVMRAGAITEILRIGGYEISINEGGGDVNFRVEGASDSNLLVVDAGTDRVGIGTSSPAATLDVASGQTFRNTRLLTVSVSGSTTLTEAAHAGRYNICAGNITLPSTSTAGEHYAILNTTGGDITIGRNGNNINGAGSDFTLATFKAATCIAIGSNNWMVVG